MAEKPRRFKALLEKGIYVLDWTMVRLPFDPHREWKQMVRLRVRGEVWSAEGGSAKFRTSLFAAADGSGYLLMVNAEVQREAGITVGSLAEFALAPDMDARPAELPDELAVLLDEEAGLRDWYDELSESMRREIGKWINGVKSEDARVRRCEQLAERLLAAMEGERELPPLLAAAFRRRPKAKVGWEKMTVAQRRQGLLAMFYYQTVEAREKRVEKLCDEAEKKA